MSSKFRRSCLFCLFLPTDEATEARHIAHLLSERVRSIEEIKGVRNWVRNHFWHSSAFAACRLSPKRLPARHAPTQRPKPRLRLRRMDPFYPVPPPRHAPARQNAPLPCRPTTATTRSTTFPRSQASCALPRTLARPLRESSPATHASPKSLLTCDHLFHANALKLR